MTEGWLLVIHVSVIQNLTFGTEPRSSAFTLALYVKYSIPSTTKFENAAESTKCIKCI